MASWIYITQMFILYAGRPLFTISLIGCIMNAIMFSTVQMYRSQPCTFFLFIASIARCLHLLTAGLLRLLAIGFNIDPTIISLPWCKMRSYIILVCYGIAITCEWLATIDRFLMTSRAPNI
ncbi:unnamed protein product [Rotaria sordida]|uniref:Uncharacterized protein n=1 Tax=Rotaria sordida TaxID=392033 RepID=A0A814PBM2_9BILA|nr:unnamed protein product [Rotaria sordida]CAF1101520.1 unnamed protein product [Rotaria sordida]CAF3759983.1 unnamed protein product [Rotaria sordida]CAF4093043.1 unnamed protein product [Rotaria sordida]